MCQKTREIASCDRHQGFVEPEPTQGRGRYVTAQIPYPHARVAGGEPRQCPEIYWTAHRRRQGPRPPEQTEAWSAVTLFSRFRTALRENPSRSRWVSQSLLTLEDTRHPLFAYYLRQWGQTGLGANSRLPVDVQEEAEEDREAGEATEGCGVDGRSQEGNRIPSSLWDLTTAQG